MSTGTRTRGISAKKVWKKVGRELAFAYAHAVACVVAHLRLDRQLAQAIAPVRFRTAIQARLEAGMLQHPYQLNLPACTH